MTLYEIDETIRRVIDKGMIVDEETGEISYDYTDLDELKEKLEAKVDNIVAYIKELSAEAEAIKNEEEALKKRRKAKENKTQSLKDYLSAYLTANAMKKYETARASLSFIKSEKVEIVDIEAIPEEYMRVKTSREPAKDDIKKAIKGGATISGCQLVSTQSLQVK